MSTNTRRVALLAAIADAPDDPTPRFIFADYLYDCGEEGPCLAYRFLGFLGGDFHAQQTAFLRPGKLVLPGSHWNGVTFEEQQEIQQWAEELFHDEAGLQLLLVSPHGPEACGLCEVDSPFALHWDRNLGPVRNVLPQDMLPAHRDAAVAFALRAGGSEPDGQTWGQWAKPVYV